MVIVDKAIYPFDNIIDFNNSNFLCNYRLWGDNDKRGFTLFSNQQLGFQLQRSLNSNLQRRTKIVEGCSISSLWGYLEMQHNFWDSGQRNTDRELFVELDYWGQFEDNHTGG